jgi:hypothetical protein
MCVEKMFFYPCMIELLIRGEGNSPEDSFKSKARRLRRTSQGSEWMGVMRICR